MIEYFGLLLGLGLVIGLAPPGTNVILAALLATLVVAAISGLNLLDALTDTFASGPLGAFTSAGRSLLLFVTGAIFGRAVA